MTKVKQTFIVAFTALLATFALGLAAFAPSAQAEEGTQDKPYSYDVTVICEDGGTYNGKKVYTEYAKYGQEVRLDMSKVKLPDNSKYYVQGFKIAGHDAIADPVFRVTESVQYVVAYGLKGQQVPYTIQYQDTNGNTLLESETFYGNVGDKPAVAYRYIEGYQPDAYNRTFTLKELGEDNVYTFVYTQVAGPVTEIVEETEETTENATGGGAGAGGAGAAGAAAGAGGATAGDAGAAAPGAAGAAEEAVVAPDGTPLAQPEQTIDEDGTPLANFANDPLGTIMNNPWMIGLAALAAAIAAGVIVLIVRNRKKKNAATTA